MTIHCRNGDPEMASSKGDANASERDGLGQWGEERQERLEYVVPDVFVHDPQFTHVHVLTERRDYRQIYVSGDAWIEVFFRVEIGGDVRKYVAVARAAVGDGADTWMHVGGVDLEFVDGIGKA